MIEQLSSRTPEHNGTRFVDGAVIDTHAGNPNLANLDDARRARVAADLAREAARAAAAEAETRESDQARTWGARLVYYRSEALRDVA